MGALLAFEAAAEQHSFAKAASKLHITPAAISQQIRLLERHLDIALFERSKKAVKLTSAGQNYLAFITDALNNIRFGQHQIQRFQELDILTITALPSFAFKYLMPKILHWMDLNQDIEVRVEASHAKVYFTRSSSDMCICFGDQDCKGVNKLHLFTDSVSLVISPSLLKEHQSPYNVESIINAHPMIHVDWGDDNNSLPSWERWFDLCDVGISAKKTGPRFNLSSMEIEAAVQGKGILLGQQRLIQNEIETGQLIKPFDLNLPLGRAYYLAYSDRTVTNKKAIELITWLSEDVTSF